MQTYVGAGNFSRGAAARAARFSTFPDTDLREATKSLQFSEMGDRATPNFRRTSMLPQISGALLSFETGVSQKPNFDIFYPSPCKVRGRVGSV